MKNAMVLITVFLSLQVYAQDPVLTIGNPFPDIVINNISNAPVKYFYLNHAKDNKLYILNFWGTWCSPCIPEMDSLAKLQKNNAATIQIIAISDDNKERKEKYLKNKPSDLWLAMDTNWTIYKMLNLAYVGQCAIINSEKKIVGLVRTDSINQEMIDQLLKGESIKMSSEFATALISKDDDPFGVDSLLQNSFTIRGFSKGRRTMGKIYPDGPYKDRRVSWFNVSIGLLYRAAFNIKSFDIQEVYDKSVTKKDVSDFDNKNTLYCLDLLVNHSQKDSLYPILQKYLNDFLPIKARLEKKMMNVYILKKSDSVPLNISLSAAANSSTGFSGKGYDGTRVLIEDFAADYLTNELGLPVVDETGLTGYYDIKTNVEQRDWKGLLKSINALGFKIEKSEREMPVIVYFKE